MDGTHYTNLFGSPLFAHKWEDSEALNNELKSTILDHQLKVQGLSRTNVGGWHSEIGKLDFCGTAGSTLVQRMNAMTNEATGRVLREYGHQPRGFNWSLHAWANVNRKGNFNQTHTHPGATWSGTYYVDTGTGSGSSVKPAPLHIFDPCQGRANTFLPPLVPSSFTIRPEPGLMILFPSYLAHMVFPQEANEPRISVAFNMRREPFP